MSELAEIYNELGQSVMPEAFGFAFPDLMNITGETRTQGQGGGQIKSASPADYSDIPVLYEPYQREQRVIIGDKAVSTNEYVLTFPVYHEGARVNIDAANQRLKVLARGGEPEKVFRITAIKDYSGVYFEAICTKEN